MIYYVFNLCSLKIGECQKKSNEGTCKLKYMVLQFIICTINVNSNDKMKRKYVAI